MIRAGNTRGVLWARKNVTGHNTLPALREALGAEMGSEPADLELVFVRDYDHFIALMGALSLTVRPDLEAAN